MGKVKVESKLAIYTEESDVLGKTDSNTNSLREG